MYTFEANLENSIEIGGFKRAESPSVQGYQSSEEDLIARERDPRGPRGNQSVSISPKAIACLFFKCRIMVTVLIAFKPPS